MVRLKDETLISFIVEVFSSNVLIGYLTSHFQKLGQKKRRFKLVKTHLKYMPNALKC
jgi:hypothetical protein